MRERMKSRMTARFQFSDVCNYKEGEDALEMGWKTNSTTLHKQKLTSSSRELTVWKTSLKWHLSYFTLIIQQEIMMT